MEMTATQTDVDRRTLGPHDLGGEVGHGRVPVEEGQSFHDDWEPRVLALVFGGALNGLFGFGDFRAAMENLHPLAYRSIAAHRHGEHDDQPVADTAALARIQYPAQHVSQTRGERDRIG